MSLRIDDRFRHSAGRTDGREDRPMGSVRRFRRR